MVQLKRFLVGWSRLYSLFDAHGEGQLVLGGQRGGGALLEAPDARLVPAGPVPFPQNVLQPLEAERLPLGDLEEPTQGSVTHPRVPSSEPRR